MKRTNLFLTAALTAAIAVSVGQEECVLRIGATCSAELVPLMVIRQMGLDQSRGFRLEPLIFPDAVQRDAALLEGKVDGVFTDYISACALQNGEERLKITGSSAGDLQLFAGKSTGITAIANAKGKTAAVSENALSDYALDCILWEKKLSVNTVQRVDLARDDERLRALREGRVDLAVLSEPYASLAAREGAVRLGGVNGCGIYPIVSAFTIPALAQKPDLIGAFYGAYDEAIADLQKMRAEELEALVLETVGFPAELSGGIMLPIYAESALPDRACFNHAVRWADAHDVCSRSLMEKIWYQERISSH